MRVKTFLLVLPLIVIFACKGPQKTTTKRLAHKKNLSRLLEQAESKQLKIDWMSVKAAISITKEGKHTGFKSNIRLRTDSMIWVSITPLAGIEFARAVFTPDSVKLINRLEGYYFIGDYEYLNQMFNTEFNYGMIQALLLGNSLSLQENDKLKSSIDKGMYLLSGLKKRALKKSIEKEELKHNQEHMFSAWVDPVTFKITKQSFLDLTSNYYLEVNYSEFKEESESLFPHNTTLTLITNNEFKAVIDYSNLYFNVPKKMPFTISSKYEEFKL
jgi:hypothetical protein|tara:strand:+ start:2840 stop:3655 length:816 start_codon:yes stop_codon:yes gene_type:complete